MKRAMNDSLTQKHDFSGEFHLATKKTNYRQMKTTKLLNCLLTFFLLTGMSCQKLPNDRDFILGKEASFQINQAYFSSDGMNTFKVKEVNDSRCPEGVVCVWAGEVTLKGDWISNGSTTSVELHSVMSGLQKQPDGYTIKIVDVKPYPKAGVTIQPEDLIITLLIQKN